MQILQWNGQGNGTLSSPFILEVPIGFDKTKPFSIEFKTNYMGEPLKHSYVKLNMSIEKYMIATLYSDLKSFVDIRENEAIKTTMFSSDVIDYIDGPYSFIERDGLRYMIKQQLFIDEDARQGSVIVGDETNQNIYTTVTQHPDDASVKLITSSVKLRVEDNLIKEDHNHNLYVSLIDLKIEIGTLIDHHIDDKTNPHEVTKEQIGLENVENKTSATIRSEIVVSDIPELPQSKITGLVDLAEEVARLEDDKADITYVDNKDANTLQEAKDYTYSKVEIDNKDTAIMNKANNLENANMLKDVNYNNVNGVLTFTKYDDTTKEIDLPLELLVESGYYDEVTNELVLVLANSSEIRIPVGNLLTDLDAHNIRFNGSGTNYLVGKTDVEGSLKKLDQVIKEIDYINIQNQDTSEMQELRLYVVGGQIGYEIEEE